MEKINLGNDPRNLDWEENSTRNQHHAINGIGHIGHPNR